MVVRNLKGSVGVVVWRRVCGWGHDRGGGTLNTGIKLSRSATRLGEVDMDSWVGGDLLIVGKKTFGVAKVLSG